MNKRVYLSPSNQTGNLYAYGSTNEAEQCEKIVAVCKKALERNSVEVEVGNRNETLQARCKNSDAFNADLHVPIHTNAFNGNVTGSRVFYYNTASNGYVASNVLLSHLCGITNSHVGKVSANPTLYEIRVPKAPTAYVEVDFHDNPDVAKWIIENTTLIGETIARGICNYFGINFIEDKQKLYRIQLGAFQNREYAEAFLKTVKIDFPDAYITVS